MSLQQMRFKLEPKVANSPDFLLFMNQSHLKIDFDSEKNEIIIEIPNESPAEIEKAIRTIDKFFKISSFASGKDLQNSSMDNNLIIDFSYLSYECSEKALTQLCKTIYWACVRKNISENEITNLFIWPIIKEISLCYSEKEIVNAQVGDVVSLINSSSVIDDSTYTKGIVCDITDNEFYIIPLLENYSASNFAENEVTFLNEKLYKKHYELNYQASRYVSKKRVESILGKVSSEFFGNILDNLSETFSFMKAPVSQSQPSNVGIQESALLDVFNVAFEALAQNGNFDSFFTEIQLTDQKLKDICIKCPDFDKVNWQSITEITTCSREELKSTFRTWLDSQQTLKEKCSTLSFTSLLKLIKKAINN